MELCEECKQYFKEHPFEEGHIHDLCPDCYMDLEKELEITIQNDD
jgi:hypothetical protein